MNKETKYLVLAYALVHSFAMFALGYMAREALDIEANDVKERMALERLQAEIELRKHGNVSSSEEGDTPSQDTQP